MVLDWMCGAQEMSKHSPYSNGFWGRVLRWFDRQVCAFADDSITRRMRDNPALAHIASLYMRDIVKESGADSSLIKSADDFYQAMIEHKNSPGRRQRASCPEACDNEDALASPRRPWGFEK